MPAAAVPTRRRRSVWSACFGAAALFLAGPLAVGWAQSPAVAHAPANAVQAPDDVTTVYPPTVTVETPATSDCTARTAPVGTDPSETVASGATRPAPMPVPRRTVGGKALAGCGFVVPKGSPALPSDITAASWLIADLTSGEVLAAKDPHGRYRPASTLKLLTLNVLLQNLKNPDQVVLGTDEDTEQEGTRVGLGPGGRYTVGELMLFLMMGSGNDVANALARANGGTAKTLTEMNEQAHALGAFDTRAATVSGLDAAGQQTSVYDLALIARANMKFPAFPTLIGTKYSKVPGWGKYPSFGIANDNGLLYGYPGAIGGKTGFTDAAGNTYVGLAKRNGRELVVTMLAGTQQPRRQWMQAASLLDWGFSLPAGTPGVGRLVGSGAEALAEPVPTNPLSTPVRPTGQVGESPASPTQTTATTTRSTSATSTTAPAPGAIGGWGMALLWAGGGLLAILAVVAVYLGLRTDPESPPER